MSQVVYLKNVSGAPIPEPPPEGQQEEFPPQYESQCYSWDKDETKVLSEEAGKFFARNYRWKDRLKIVHITGASAVRPDPKEFGSQAALDTFGNPDDKHGGIDPPEVKRRGRPKGSGKPK